MVAQQTDNEAVSQAKYDGIRKVLETVRCAPSPGLDIDLLAAQRCPCCATRDFAVLRYPAYRSAFFSGLLLATCRRCGLSWVPKADLDLEHYYTKVYASEVRPERLRTPLHVPDNPIWHQPKHAVRDRARRLNAFLAPYSPFESVLDIGAGEGLFLSMMKAQTKYADELDEASRRILQDELSVTIRALKRFDGELSLVTALHVLEHLTYQTIHEQLRQIRRALAPGGLFLCEVPSGGTQIAGFEAGRRTPRGRFEPHTLFFSSNALVQLLREADFEIVEASRCGWAKNHLSKTEQAAVFGDSRPHVYKDDKGYSTPIVVLARVPTTSS